MEQDTMSENVPNQSMMYQTYTPTFGNFSFAIQPSQTGEVNDNFGVIPYLSLESMVYMQQMQAQTAPTSILPGQNTGQQNVQGQYTVTDSTGNVRVQMGSGKF
jgi:hypothetical protein